MKSKLIAFTLLASLTHLLSAAEIKSGVTHWDMLTAKVQDSTIHRPILKGNTLDLASLEIFATTIPVSEKQISSLGKESAEKLLIINEGKVKLTIGGQSDVLVPGSLAVLHPGSSYTIENADNIPVTYYVFRYLSKDGFKKDAAEKGPGSFMVNWDDVEYMPSDIGGRRNNFDCPTAMMNRFEFHTSTLNGGLTNHAAHTHRAEEMVLVLKGKVEMMIGGKHYTASEGDVFFIEAEILHSLQNVSGEPAEYFAFQWM